MYCAACKVGPQPTTIFIIDCYRPFSLQCSKICDLCLIKHADVHPESEQQGWLRSAADPLECQKKKLFYSVKSGEESDMSPVFIISAYKWTSALQVKYKSNQNQKPEGSSDLPNLLQLEHVLHASKLQSNVRHHHSPA